MSTYTSLSDVKVKDEVSSWPQGVRDGVKSHFNRVAIDEDLKIEKIYSICRARTPDEFPGMRTNCNFVLVASNEPFEADARKAAEQKLERWSELDQDYQRAMRTGDQEKVAKYNAQRDARAKGEVVRCGEDGCKKPSTTIVDGVAYCAEHLAKHRDEKVMA